MRKLTSAIILTVVPLAVSGAQLMPGRNANRDDNYSQGVNESGWRSAESVLNFRLDEPLSLREIR